MIVILYDIRTGRVCARMDRASAEHDLQIWRELGIPLQEYDTADRQGRPLRVVYQIDPSPPDRAGAARDLGGVYEFTA